MIDYLMDKPSDWWGWHPLRAGYHWLHFLVFLPLNIRRGYRVREMATLTRIARRIG